MTHDDGYLVAILSYGAPDPALAVARRLSSDGVPDRSVLILVNPDQEAGVDLSAYAPFPTATFAHNVGYAAAMNHALSVASEAQRRVAILLTHDVEIGRTELEELAGSLEGNPDYALVGPVMLDQDGLVFSAGGTRAQGSIAHSTAVTHDAGIMQCAWIDGAALAARVDALSPLEFDERFFLYCEDVDIAFRLRRQGWRIGVVPNATAQQKSMAVGRRAAYGYLRTRNLLEAFWKDRAFVAVLHYLARLLHGAVRKRTFRSPEMVGAVHFLMRRFGPPPAKFSSGSDISFTQ